MSDNFLVSFGTYYKYFSDSMAVPEASVKIEKFNDGEISVKFEESLRGKHIFLFGETTHNLTELILTLDAAKRSSAKEITVVLPYYGYSRQDKRESVRGSIGAKAIAHVIESMGADRIITIDLHAAQIQGYFQIPVEHLSGRPIFEPYVKRLMEIDDDIVLCSPDAGGTLRVSKFADSLGLPVVTINKRRAGPGVVKSMELYGSVEGKRVIIIDDIADTCGTLVKAAQLLKEHGAISVMAIATHPVLSSHAMNNLSTSNHLDDLLTSNTLAELISRSYPTRLKYFSCANLLQDAIFRVANEESLMTMND